MTPRSSALLCAAGLVLGVGPALAEQGGGDAPAADPERSAADPKEATEPQAAGAEEAKQAAQQDAEAAEAVAMAEVDPDTFANALDDFYAGDYPDAAAGFWHFTQTAGSADENHEWAQFFLAESLRGLGLWHGAVFYYYQVAKTRSQPEILPKALSRLEEISRTRPLSERLIYHNLLYDAEFGVLPGTIDHWVHYVQGLLDYRNGFIRWGNAHFDLIPKDSEYGLEAAYVKAVFALQRKKDRKAIDAFQKILDSPGEAPEVKNRANMSLARLHFDAGEHEKALEYYNKVVQINLSFAQAQLLMEKAWSAYYGKQYRKAMGLMHALDAPSYARYFLPDTYILRALIFKDLCHFMLAKKAVRSFRFKFAHDLKLLRQRAPLHTIKRIAWGAVQEGPMARLTHLLRSLRDERRRIELYDTSWEDVYLDAHLRKLYDLEIREQARLWRRTFRESGDRIALQLLETEEQMTLLDYEVGLDIFRRVSLQEATTAAEEKLVVPYDSANVYYEFTDEYWNDELHSYEYYVTNRCFERKEEP